MIARQRICAGGSRLRRPTPQHWFAQRAWKLLTASGQLAVITQASIDVAACVPTSSELPFAERMPFLFLLQNYQPFWLDAGERRIVL